MPLRSRSSARPQAACRRVSSADPNTLHCPRCGAHLTVNGSSQTLTCAYCQTSVLVPQHIWRRFHPAPAPMPNAGSATSTATRVGLVIGGVAVLLGIVVIVVIVFVANPTPAPVAAAGEPCNGRVHACSKDGRGDMSCGADEKMVVSGTCKGPNGCRVIREGASIACDTTLADPGDPCTFVDSSCSTDHRAEVRCEGGRYVVTSSCKGPDGCTLTPSAAGSGHTLSCDDRIADVGDPCFDPTRAACSSDKKSLLTCTAQRFVVARACDGCTVQKIVGTDNKRLICP